MIRFWQSTKWVENRLPGQRSSAGGKHPLLQQLRTRLLLLVLLPLLPAVGLIVHACLRERRIEQERAQSDAIALARLVAARETKFIHNARQLLTTVGSVGFLVNSTNRQFCQTHLINLRTLMPDYLDFGLIESNGVLFCSAANTNSSPDLSSRWDFQLVLKTKQFVLGDFQVGGHTTKQALHFGYPILSTDGAVHRVFYASLNMELLSEAAAQVNLPDNSSITVFDSRGSVVACFPDSDKWIGKSWANTDRFRLSRTIRNGVFQATGHYGRHRLYAVAPISDGINDTLLVAVGIPTEVSFARAHQVLVRDLSILGAVGLLALSVTLAYSRKFLLQPLSSVAAIAKRLSSGHLNARTGLKPGMGEISDVAVAIDELAEALQKREAQVDAAHKEISAINAELEQRVLKRTAEFEMSNRELEIANRELEAFCFSVSHDLRAPLRHIDAYARILETEFASELGEEGKNMVLCLARASKRMDRLIEDLLAFSKAGRQPLKKCVIHTDHLVYEIVHELLPETKRRNIQWEIGALPDVCADGSLLRQVWSNLILNAVKYTSKEKHPRIKIDSLTRSDGQTVFFVQDNGVGFDMQYAEKLFCPFQRLHSDNEFEGSGVGLAIVSQIISRHGGEVWAESKVGHGANLFFTVSTVLAENNSQETETRNSAHASE